MNAWQEAYDSGFFNMTTDQPSDIVRNYAELIPDGSRVVDLGCGPGRNAMFLASLGHPVDALDTVDLGWSAELSPEQSELINFKQQDVNTLQFEGSSIGAILMIRLIQYLPTNQVEELIAKSSQGLIEGGLLFVTYTASGGGHDVEEFKVSKYKHPFSRVLEMVSSSGLSVVHAKEINGPPSNTTVQSGLVHACELAATKKQINEKASAV